MNISDDGGQSIPIPDPNEGQAGRSAKGASQGHELVVHIDEVVQGACALIQAVQNVEDQRQRILDVLGQARDEMLMGKPVDGPTADRLRVVLIRVLHDDPEAAKRNLGSQAYGEISHLVRLLARYDIDHVPVRSRDSRAVDLL